ncbi:MAG: hypothetical protein WCH86_04420, partial [Kiritimatiellales bacterium]
MNNMKKRIFSMLPLALPVALSAADAPKPAAQPNILWLVAEDANIKWFGCYGSDQATTPNID